MTVDHAELTITRGGDKDMGIHGFWLMN
uniref:Uncharacterized protein n=1 Tax=Oryza meridionalis TaxID=40149 RepID=A0A0E0D9B9_9ORYZ